ncbi:MAG: CRTAC1 family protein [Planctomycetota bacterium]
MKVPSNLTLFAAGGLALSAPCLAQEDGVATVFQDETDAWGVYHQDYGGTVNFQMGVGAAWVDYDADGDEDLFLLRGGGESRLMRRDAATFVDVQAQFPSLSFDNTVGVIAADFDQDGRGDLYITTTAENQLLQSQADGTFAERSDWGAGGSPTAFSTSASVADFDRDGDLDLYVGNYVRVLGFPYHVGEPNNLFVNGGTSGQPSFTDVARELNVGDTGFFGPSVPGFPYISPEGEPTAGCTLSTCTLDVDEDGWPDIQVGNDFGEWVLPNRLYRNTSAGGSLSFQDLTEASGFDDAPQYNMGINPCDFDHDGDWDFYLSNLGDNVLLRNDGGVFADAVQELGPVEGLAPDGFALLTSWGTTFADLDNDGWEDLYVVNGYIPAADFIENALREANALWMNNQGVSFTRVDDAESGCGDEGVGRAGIEADVNGDGLLDFYVTNNRDISTSLPEDASRLFINQGPAAAGNHWLMLKLSGRFSNREGIGTAVNVVAGTETLRRQLRADPVYLASATRVLHFGLGTVDEVERIDLRWPSGIQQTLLSQGVDEQRELREPLVTVGALEAPSAAGGVVTLGANVRNHDAVPAAATLTFRVELAAGGGPVIEQSFDVNVPPGASLVQVNPSLAGLSARGYSGQTLRVTVTAEADGSLDMGRAQF